MKVDAQIEEDSRQTIYYLKGYSYLKFYCQKQQSNQKPTANTVSTLRRTTLSWVRGDIKELLSVNDINEINHIWTAEMNRKMKKWSSQCTPFMQLREEAWKKVLNFFSGFFTQLHKLRSLRRSFLHFHKELLFIKLTLYLSLSFRNKS